mgnify:CR=1 FL=1
MLYHLLLPHADVFTAFNVFRYITFRSMGALITAMVISVLIGPWCISFLHRIKCGQYILSDVKAHAAKAGTPTMGGLLIMLTVLVSILLWSDLSNRYVWQCMLVFLGYGIIGFWDDMTKLRHHQNKGISPKAKMLGLIIVASVAMWLLQTDPSYTTKLYIPFAKGWTPDLGVFYFPFGVFVMVASSNAVNLTDGLDGLAIGPTVLAGAVFAIFIYITGKKNRFFLFDRDFQQVAKSLDLRCSELGLIVDLVQKALVRQANLRCNVLQLVTGTLNLGLEQIGIRHFCHLFS